MSEDVIRDPKPSIERIESLARRIFEGDILLPKFQRDFIWKRNQVLELFDSISKNYPIGSILLWLSKHKLKSESSIADLPFKERPEEYPVNYLLDGQQRLSCICGALYWKPNAGESDSVWNIAYDLKSRRFVHLNTLDDPPQHQIRLNKIPDNIQFFAQVAVLEANPDNSHLAAEAKRFFSLFKDYSLACVTLHDMPIENVAPIFERINSTGTKLTIVDLMRAATWSVDFDLVETIDQKVLDVIGEKGFDEIDRKAVLRVLSSASGFSFSTGGIDRLRSLNVEQLKTSTEATVSAFKLATDFLHDQLKIPNASIVPYVNQVVVLAELFRRRPVLNAGQYVALRQWFWRTTLSSYFSGWSSAQMDTDLKAIDDFISEKTPNLMIGDGAPPKNIWRRRSFRANTSLSKLLGLLLTQNTPYDLINGTEVKLTKALAWQNSKEYHHIFPKAYLNSIGASTSDTNALANFALISSASNKNISDTKPSVYVPKLQIEHGQDFSRICESNLLSGDCVAAAIADNFPDFLEARSTVLHKFALSLAGWPVEE